MSGGDKGAAPVGRGCACEHGYWPLLLPFGAVAGAFAGGGAEPVVAAGGFPGEVAVRSPPRPRPKIKASTTTMNRAAAIQPTPLFALRISRRVVALSSGSAGSRS